MKRLYLFILLTFFSFFAIYSAKAFVRYEDKNPRIQKEVIITGFINYDPFGVVANPEGPIYGRFYSIFQPMLEELAAENNWKIAYELQKNKYETLVQEPRNCEISFLSCSPSSPL